MIPKVVNTSDLGGKVYTDPVEFAVVLLTETEKLRMEGFLGNRMRISPSENATPSEHGSLVHVLTERDEQDTVNHPYKTAIDKDRFAGRRNGEDSEEITSVEATWQHLQSSRKHSPRNRGPGSNGSKSTATTRATTGQHDDQTKVTPRRRGRQPRANTPKL
ncbi:hypothetical protein HPB50_013452 [Hyalomma asiaticum]|uniref:Uncharacterized protein n=1 Tax=Hyalomma asiaticum TaxID=266040 RepID=A0ACB7RMJ9_HYAAI|nr:hypothetical protein HPB50_013452 [Hyalomma asiaticum]